MMNHNPLPQRVASRFLQARLGLQAAMAYLNQEVHTPEEVAEMSDNAVNSLREYVRNQEWPSSMVRTLLLEEMDRITPDIQPDADGLTRYLRVSRAGSHYPLDRGSRTAVFLTMVTTSNKAFRPKLPGWRIA